MPAIIAPKKLIEVALPLDEINKASAREKSIRHGHPSTLHLWWARRPLAAARAVLFAQLVNDPSWKYTTEELRKNQIKGAITKRRNELFKLITELVQWENTTNEDVLERARKEIRASWKETCEANKGHPDAKAMFDPNKLPAFHDPFAGGGSLPLEAQRLGLTSHASDLNPVAVLINKAILELPSRFVGLPPVGPLPSTETQTAAKATEDWSGSRGLSEDVRRYGAWVREQAEKRIGYLYRPVTITSQMVRKRPDLARYVARTLPVIAWLWARTVTSPNPAAKGALTPLVASYLISEKAGKEVWVQPLVDKGRVSLELRVDALAPGQREALKNGSRSGKAQDFVCLHTGSPVSREYVRDEGKAGRLGETLMAVVVQGDREQLYLSSSMVELPRPSPAHAALVLEARRGFLAGAVPTRAMITGGVCSAYGLDTWGSLYTDRQIIALTTFSDLVEETRVRVRKDAQTAERPDNPVTGPAGYADALAAYIALSTDRLADRNASLCGWDTAQAARGREATVRNVFARQSLPMVWDFAEVNILSETAGSYDSALRAVALVVERLHPVCPGYASQMDAMSQDVSVGKIVSTDPPYYDNIAYSDLSDFFYVWLRRSLKQTFPDLFATLAVPKDEELVASRYRRGGKKEADTFFLDGMTLALRNLAQKDRSDFPTTIYYAFKQADTKSETGTSSTGWETFLRALLDAGLGLTGTWPMRTELANRMVGSGTNALASSIVLVCRPRLASAGSVARKEFLRQLEEALPVALAEMIADPEAAVAPVDLAQAAIGPGMAIFSKYAAVLEADGEPMSVHNALIHINKAIDNFFAEAEGELDADTRFCIDWFQQHGFDAGPFGEADVLARAKGTAVDGVVDVGVLAATKGKVRLLRIKEYPRKWDPATDSRLAIWEACHHMCRALGESEHEAGGLLARMPEKQDAIRQLAYRLYTICERQKWAEEARAYNDLITSWPAIVEESHRVGHAGTQLELV